MDPLALGLVLFAAMLHATWNVLLKQAGDGVRFAAVGLTATAVVVMPASGFAWVVLGRPTLSPQAIGLSLLSGAVEVAYVAFLAAAYSHGDLSTVYPLARGSAPVIAIVIGVGFLGEQLMPTAWAGVALTLLGLLVIQQPWHVIARNRQNARAAAFALLTGLSIATYTVIDRIAVRTTAPWLYAATLWPACAIGLWLLVLVRGRLRKAQPAVAVDRRVAVVSGLMGFVAYSLVLAALSRAPLALVAPLRETSIILTAIWGIARLREAVRAREVGVRLTGSALVLAGVAVLAVGH